MWISNFEIIWLGILSVTRYEQSICWRLYSKRIRSAWSYQLDSYLILAREKNCTSFHGQIQKKKVGIDLVVSEPLKDVLFLLLFKLQLYKMEIGVVKNVNKTVAKSFGNYIARPRYICTPAYCVLQWIIIITLYKWIHTSTVKNNWTVSSTRRGSFF